MFMLLSLNAVKISERAEISAPNAPAPGPGKAAPAPVAEARPANAQPGNHAQAIVGAAALTAEGAAQLDRGLKFTPEEQAARQKIDAKLAEVDGKDYFAMLDVTPASDAAAIKKAYFAVARAFHPDAFPGLNLGSGAAKLNHLYSLLSIAYETLTDPKKRGEYDAKMSFEQTGGSSDVGAIMAAEADFHKAQFLVERGEMKAALGLIERALVAMPANEELMGYKLYAQWWAKRDRAEAANLIRELERLYKAAPAAHAMREFQGWLHLELEDVKKARAAFEYAAQHRPGSQGAAKGIRAVARKQEELDKKSSGGGLGRFLKR
jgi:curved DNA-binding protein CbpA